jgi:hypothetical protein
VSSSVPLLLSALLVTGAGVALTFPATRVAAIDAAPPRYAALASGVLSTSRYFGGMLGAIIATVTLGGLPAASRAPTLFAVLALSGALASVASLWLPGSARTSAAGEIA